MTTTTTQLPRAPPKNGISFYKDIITKYSVWIGLFLRLFIAWFLPWMMDQNSYLGVDYTDIDLYVVRSFGRDCSFNLIFFLSGVSFVPLTSPTLTLTFYRFSSMTTP